VTSPHFAWLPPEINSALIFAGPGAAPLLAAAAAWDGLAEDLASSASSFFSVTSDLANGSWQGASAAAMMAVATQYVGWLSAAAAQAEAASSQASAIAAAFETALAATVQPAVVAANRALVQALVATNWFGLNAPAIMDTESAYEQMWASDVAAMFGYHADASEAAAQLAPWQQVLEKVGFSFNNGKMGFGPITLGNSNVGVGNSGSLNMGSGNSGNNNLGLGNLGNNNFGFGNSGNNDFGIGLTGNNQIGFGGFNSGTGNIGFFNSGNNNIGFFNSGTGNFGIGNAGTSNAGFANSGSVNTGFFNTGTANAGFYDNAFAGQTGADALGSGRYLTGGVSAANLSSGLLNTVTGSTGGLSAGVPSPGLLSPAASAFAGSADPSAIAGGVESSGAHANVAGPASGPTTTPPALRTTTAAPSGFFPAGGNTRESSIPNSGFFNKVDRGPGAPDPGIRVPDLPE
jgi:PPE family/Pentapeptide repeats (8 copies)